MKAPKAPEENMGRVVLDLELANHEDVVLASAGAKAKAAIRRVTVTGIVDTGAAHLVIPKRIADQLGVPLAGKACVRYADQRNASRSVVRDVDVHLLGRQGTFKAIVEPNRRDVLIGAIVLEDLDFVVNCQLQRLEPRDPDRIVSEIE